ncbi:MAG TPA: amino acid permease [Acidobacteriota bacterium]|jgi:APA family basic amino acid/polyamine antiporter
MDGTRLTELKRVMGLGHATAMVVGTIIGASIFVQPSEITRQVPSITGVFLAWAVAGLLTFCGALACAELASAFPQTGGVYVFLRETYSPALGFLWGWAMFWSMHTGIIAAIAVIFARYVGYFVRLDEIGARLVAIGGILVLSGINYAGVKQGSRVQALFTLGKGIAVVAILLLLTLGSSGVSAGGAAAGHRIPVHKFALAVAAGLFAFGGWHMVTYTAGETRRPERTIPLALMIGTLVVTACYVALNAAYFHVLPLEQVVSSTRVAADAAETLFGTGGGGAVSALVIFSTFGALSGIVLAGPRVYFAMARDGVLFSWIAAVHPRFQTPHRAIMLQAVWASMLVATGSYRALFTRVIYTEWIFFGLMVLGLFLLRRRPDYAPAYRTWGYPVLPAIFIVASLFIVLNQIASDPRESAIGLGLVALGWPAYYFWGAKS